jgi:hypothetical protein
MPDLRCAVAECNRKRYCRGWCTAHYQRWRAAGDPLGSLVPDMAPDLTGEQWRNLPGYEGIYQASDLGRIRSLDRVVMCPGGPPRSLRGRVLRPSVRPDERHVVSLWMDGKAQTRSVHSLVALAFLGPCPEGLECCHFDGDPSNNRAANLRWDTRVGNMADMARHGNNYQRNKVRCPRGHILAAPNLARAVNVRRGHRCCLACGRARDAKWRAARRGDTLFDFQAVADVAYAKIMAA